MSLLIRFASLKHWAIPPSARFSWWPYVVLLISGMLQITNAAAQPVAVSLSTMVDKFTGDLNYSLPLLTVPGPNGEEFPITIQYQGGGIAMDQTASDIGLGWTMSIGEIARKVNGHPDDVLGAIHKRTELFATPTYESTKDDLRVYGPVYFRSIPNTSDALMQLTCTTCASMDIYSTRAGRSGMETSFEFPDYDDYSALGPALSAKLEMHLFDYSSIFKQPRLKESAQDYFDHVFGAPPPVLEQKYERATRRPTLMINEAKTLNIVAPVSKNYRSFVDVNSPNAGIQLPCTVDINVSQGTDLIIDNASSLPKSGYFVQYFTNEEIHAHYNGQAGDVIPDFLDWETEGTYPDRNNATYFELNGIGAIQVTDPNGFTYHYSLPIYVNPEIRFAFDLAYQEGVGYVAPSTANPIVGAKVERFENNYRYASTWKLSAITGPDFVDVNVDHRPDIHDTGYWIRFDYAKWSANYPTRFPFFGFQEDLSGDQNALSYGGAMNYGTTPYRKTGTSIRMDHEVYYLNSITTATHTAYFIHDVRFDEFSFESTPKPKLKLSEIVLVRNEDVPVNAFPGNTLPTNGPFSSFTPAGNVYNSAQVGASGLRSVSLASVVFDQDYSLARTFQNNIYSGTASGIGAGPNEYAGGTLLFNRGPGSFTPGNLELSGKLTLKGLTFKHDGAEQTMPGYEFTYFQEIVDGSTTDPLLYAPEKKDHFGHYKYDYDPANGGNYTTFNSTKRSHAWSLATITDPLGAKVTVTYEPDEYDLIGYGFAIPVPPARYY